MKITAVYSSCLLSGILLLGSFFDSEDGGDIQQRTCVTFEKIELARYFE
jgi:hypothetical protein